MIGLINYEERCFADSGRECDALTIECAGYKDCVFYKPASCADWIKREVKGKVWIIPPEEYYEV